MKKALFNNITLATGLMGLATLGLQSCSKPEFSEDYDIKWPVPVIANVTPLKDTIGKAITITGEKFEKLSKVTIGNPEVEAKIISATPTTVRVTIPRTATAGPVRLYTLYKQSATSSQIVAPVYLDAKVTNWPSRITRGEAFVIKGDNMDMVEEVEIADKKINIVAGPNASTTDLVVVPQGIELPDNVVVKITKAKAGIVNGTSPSIRVENPGDSFIPEAPILVFDFESGSNPFVQAGGSPASGFNQSGAPNARGQRYLTVTQAGAANWTYLGDATANGPFDLTKFHKPHVSFMVNTRGKQGYVQVELGQAATKWGAHFTPANSQFDYVMTTADWTWVTLPIDPALFGKWGGTGTALDPKGILEYVKLGFSTGNGAGDWEVNVDHVMITDGPQKPVFTAFTFEDGVNPYSGSAENGLNLSGIPGISGAKYLTVRLNGAASWNWTGDIYKGGPVDLSNVANATLNFWVNTNGKQGFFQFETTQGGIKWGGNVDAQDYLITTNGWKLYSLRLSEIGWSKWGGSGTATNLDPKGILDYIKIGFSTGNIVGNYEVNIDDIIISEGPMF